MAIKIKWIFLILTGLSTVFLGISLGEEFITPSAGATLGACCLMALFPMGWFLGKPSGTSRWVFALALPMLLFLSWLGSSWDLRGAIIDCGQKSDQLREALSQYHQQHGKYPESLDQLDWARLPGGRWIGKSILHYDFGIKSYRLYFSPQLRKDRWASCSTPRKK